jgi:ABC-type transport system involved in multi-copper enzyme maturation permease subunit
MRLRATWTVFRFECGRTFNAQRLAAWLALALFPVGLLALMQSQGAALEKGVQAGLAMFVLVPELTCVMGLLLWAAPVVCSELEGRTWTYLAVSPAGKDSIMVGKYLAAIFWTILTAWISLSLAAIVVRPEKDALRLWCVLAGLIPMSCLAYGALYVFFGVLFLKRAMVAAVAYTFISEVLVSFIPAVINRITVQYHLRSLLVKWMLDEHQTVRFVRPPTIDGMSWKSLAEQLSTSGQLDSNVAPWQHVLMLVIYAVTLLALAMVMLKRRELVLADQT